MKGSMSEQAEKHFNGRLWSVLILSVILICMGMSGVWNELKEWRDGSGVLVVVGVWCILLGGWGISFSKKRNQCLPDFAVILWFSSVILVRGWVPAMGAAIFAGAAVFSRMDWNEDSVFFVILSMMLFGTALFLLYVYRKRYILLHDGRIICRYYIRRKVFSQSDVKEIRVMEARYRGGPLIKTGYRFMGVNGKTLFFVERDMVHVQEFMNQFPELYQKEAVVYAAVNRKKTEGW